LRKAVFYILLSIIFLQTKGQSQSISGVVNSYYKVTEVFATYIQMDLGEDLSTLNPGDKIVLMQMTGVDVFYPGFETDDNLIYNNFGNSGHYEMLSVKSVDNSTGVKRIEVTVTLDPGKYTAGEKIQIIKIFEADYATVTGTLSAKKWDSNEGTGGVVALVIFKKLTLNANIEANFKGFLGAQPLSNYTAGCNSEAIYYYQSDITDKAGRKGEGCVTTTWDYHIGPGRIVTGGGGGIGKFAGGGGGGHYGAGAGGGRQFTSCSVTNAYATGGLFLGSSFYNDGRVTMGGGGGSSTENTDTLATRGGDGGGIVIILADTLENMGTYQIQSLGEPVTTTAMAGGGGGGAGGAVLLDINVYADAVTVDVRGGKGGNTGSQISTGAGGGGGGGIFRFAGDILSSLINFTYSGGNRGVSPAAGFYNGGAGLEGDTLRRLELPLNGFLFNSLTGTDTICQNQIPRTIRGSMPKGGETPYTYQWIQSTDSTNWVPAVGTVSSLQFTPVALYQTTWFNRIVTSNDLIVDTAKPVKVYVWDSIAGNGLDIRDTLCFNTSPGTLTGGTITNGGDGNYAYRWQSSISQLSWSDRGTGSSQDEGDLTQTTYYRRIVTSAKVCADTSNIDTLTVLSLINNNIFTNAGADTAICEGLNGGLIRASMPTGGDDTYSYTWLVSSDNISYSVIGGANGQNHGAGILSSDKYYKRVVYSGSDDVCRDTTVPYPITVYPSISGNSISTDSSRYCAGDIPEIFNGDTPTGGNEPNYVYSWWIRELAGIWEQIDGETDLSYTPSTIFTDSVEIRREVASGSYNACIDESNTIQVDVIPYIINNLVSENEAVCEESQPVAFTEVPAEGAAGGFEYMWQITPEGTEDWLPASEAITANNLISYSSPGLNESSLYRRRVISQICTSFSDTITITVYPFISNNSITGGDIQFDCYNSPMPVLASIPQDGNDGDYTYFWEESLDETTWTDAAGNSSEQDYTSPPLTDTIFYRRIVHSGETAQCKDTTDAVLIRINPLPTGDIISSIDTVCKRSPVTVFYENLTGATPWTIAMGESFIMDSATGLTNATGNFAIVVLDDANLIMLDLKDANNCHSDLAGNTGLVNLTVKEIPDAFAGENDSVCGPEYILSATPSEYTGVWSGTNGQFSSATDPDATVTITNYGEQTYTWTVTNWQCDSTSDVDIIFYEEPDQPNAGEDFNLDNKYRATLNAEEPLFGESHWQFVNGTGSFEANDSTSNNATVRFNGPGEYTLMWSVKNGVCEPVGDEIQISINDLETFTGFSPNGDGVNDDFILILSGEVDAELIIFDQWGGVVFDSGIEPNAEEFRWDGTLKDTGKDVPEGTYFYVLKQTGKSNVKKYVELRR
jgi:gliding motility-associated-like protein